MLENLRFLKSEQNVGISFLFGNKAQTHGQGRIQDLFQLALPLLWCTYYMQRTRQKHET